MSPSKCPTTSYTFRNFQMLKKPAFYLHFYALSVNVPFHISSTGCILLTANLTILIRFEPISKDIPDFLFHSRAHRRKANEWTDDETDEIRRLFEEFKETDCTFLSLISFSSPSIGQQLRIFSTIF